MLYYRSLLALLLCLPAFLFPEDVFFILKNEMETPTCIISYIHSSKDEEFVVKQIKDLSSDQQLLLVLDTLGCQIAEEVGIPLNKVRLISAGKPFVGKKMLDFPATLHTLAMGLSLEEDNPFPGLDIHQRFRRKNSPAWDFWGPLPIEKTGLTKVVVRGMSYHADLPLIVALDTFVGNADRSYPNIYYDNSKDRFCGIDMAASFNTQLAFYAALHLEKTTKNDFSSEELAALISYKETLESLLKIWPAKRQKQALWEITKKAGFKKEAGFFDKPLYQRICFHIKNIDVNYAECVRLMEVLNTLLGEGL